jgi:hypothetical protein
MDTRLYEPLPLLLIKLASLPITKLHRNSDSVLLYRCKKKGRSSPVIAIHLVQDIASTVTYVSHWVDSWQLLQGYSPFDSPVLGQLVRQTDIVGDIQKWFDHFVKSGQAAAFFVGLVAGYLVKTFTSFG